MTKNYRAVLGLIAVVLLLAAGCGHETAETRSRFNNYRDIPGVSAAEIEAIEALKRSRPEFVYGINLSSEGFLNHDKQVDGFAMLFCQRLSELFDAKFSPYIYTWEELKEKLDRHVIDFTGELTPTPQRLSQYIMTDPIAQRIGKIFVNRHNESLKLIANDRPIRCAFLEDSTLYTIVKNTWRLPFVAIFADDTDLPRLFAEGKIDAFIDENTVEGIFENCDFIKMEDYFPIIYSPVSMMGK